MDIRNRKELCEFAGRRLEDNQPVKKISVIFASVVIGLSIVSALVNYVLGLQIDQSGGLSKMGLRSTLSALQTMLPLVQSAVLMCVELGYSAAMLRTARGQYVSPQTLRLGFDRFWVLLRYTLVEGLLLTTLAFGAAYLGMIIFLATPLSGQTMELLVPLLQGTSVLNNAVSIPDGIYQQVVQSITPAYVICGILFCVGAAPVVYALRMCSYVIIEKPGFGAMAAIRESRKMMRGNRLHLFKLDLRLWWFYLASGAASVVCYGDQILPLLGVELPFSQDVSFFLFYGLYWIAQFAIFVFLLPRVEVPYALAYDAIRPKEQPAGGVVLGNIFQM